MSELIEHGVKKYEDTEEELKLFLEAVVDLIAIIDENGFFNRISEAWTDLLGWSQTEFLEMNWKDIIHKDDLIETEFLIKNRRDDGLIRGLKNRYRCKDGSYKWLEWNCKLLKEKGLDLVTVRDITENVEMERRSNELQKVIELETIKSEFFANISHEFKTPINIILGTVQLLNIHIDKNNIKYNSEVDLKRYSKSVKQNSFRLLRLVNNLIDMTKIDTGFYEIHLENRNIISIIEEITLSVAQYIGDKGITLTFDTNEEEEVIACDPDKIERIMLNLLSNAIKYTPKDGKIDVNIKVNSKDIEISVEDNGIGIAREKLDVIFERFIQVDNTLTRQSEGSGIGLSLVKSLVEMHGGSVSVESEVNKGTKFIFRLPKITTDNQSNLQPKVIKSRVEKCEVEFSDIYS